MDAALEIRLEAARRGWTQERLGEVAGVSRPTVANAWHGAAPLRAQAAQALVEELFGDRTVSERALIFQALCTVERATSASHNDNKQESEQGK